MKCSFESQAESRVLVVGSVTPGRERVRYPSEPGKRFPRFLEVWVERGRYPKRFLIDFPESLSEFSCDWPFRRASPDLVSSFCDPLSGSANRSPPSDDHPRGRGSGPARLSGAAGRLAGDRVAEKGVGSVAPDAEQLQGVTGKVDSVGKRLSAIVRVTPEQRRRHRDE